MSWVLSSFPPTRSHGSGSGGVSLMVGEQDEEELWLLSIDYSKAFDSVFHDALWKVLKEFGVPQHLIWLGKNLYGEAWYGTSPRSKTESFRLRK